MNDGATLTAKDTNPKDAIGTSKHPSSTVPLQVIAELGVAMLEGSCKYGRHNYRIAGVRSSIYYDALRRHMDKWFEGEDIDEETGLSHVTKAMACLVVLRDAMLNNKLNDDRPPRINPEFWRDLQKKTDALLERYPTPKQPFTELNSKEVR